MPLGQAIFLGAIQGLTEFLPISSSAHLYVLPTLLGWEYPGIAFDVALHGGTLLAVVLAFWKDWWILLRDAFAADPSLRAPAHRTWLQIVVASVPAAAAGWLLQGVAETHLRALPIQAVTLVVFGFLLWWVDRSAAVRRPDGDPGWAAMLITGLAQAVSLVPGVSRSGVTITAARAAGLSRVAAARTSFLLAAPFTAGALLVESRHITWEGQAGTLIAGVLSAGAVGLLAIHGLLRWVSRAGFGFFFAYRAGLAGVIVWTLMRG
jgi:undecaprenyl-diphosphatase